MKTGGGRRGLKVEGLRLRWSRDNEVRVFVPRRQGSDWHRAGTLSLARDDARALVAVLQIGCQALGVPCEVER